MAIRARRYGATFRPASGRAGLGWPLPDGLDDEQLETLLYPPPPAVAAELRPVPDWAVVHRELRRPNVTLSLLWEEYRGGTGSTGPLCGSCRRHLMNMPTGSAAG